MGERNNHAVIWLTKNYFPIVSDKNFVNQLVTKTDDIAPSLKSLGMTKNINRFANNPVMIQDIFKVFANHVDQMSNYNAFAASESWRAPARALSSRGRK